MAQIQIQIPNKYLRCGREGLVFWRNDGWIMKNMDKGLPVPKWVLIIRHKKPQMPQILSAQDQKFWILIKKGLIGRP